MHRTFSRWAETPCISWAVVYRGSASEDQELEPEPEPEPEQSGNVPSSLGVERGLRTARNLTLFSPLQFSAEVCLQMQLAKESALEQDRVANW